MAKTLRLDQSSHQKKLKPPINKEAGNDPARLALNTLAQF